MCKMENEYLMNYLFMLQRRTFVPKVKICLKIQLYSALVQWPEQL